MSEKHREINHSNNNDQRHEYNFDNSPCNDPYKHIHVIIRDKSPVAQSIVPNGRL